MVLDRGLARDSTRRVRPTSPARSRRSTAPTGLPEPRLQALQNIANAYGRDILAATVGTDVSPALVLALISVESSGRAGGREHRQGRWG